MALSSFLLIVLFAFLALAQTPPRIDDSSFKVLRSPVNGNVTISYKSPSNGTCTTTFASQQQFTGYVTLPPKTLAPIQQDYTINTFFWFIEARNSPETAPLTIWLNGGPGSSSMIGLFQENGPCEVIETGKDTLGTKAREWGWDRASNLLYIDQPNQVGFSYDSLTNATLNLFNDRILNSTSPNTGLVPNWTQVRGTFSSGNAQFTTNTTEISAFAVWHMLQGFFDAFPKYKASVNLFAESYGGKYGPVFARVWADQNERRRNGTIPSARSSDIKLASLGIVNGCIDDTVQGVYYPRMATNNTYGIQAWNATTARVRETLYNRDCEPAIAACRAAASTSDPTGEGDVPSVNRLCGTAYSICSQALLTPWASTNRSYYDIAHFQPDPFPSSQYLSYLNTAPVQSSLGTPLNFTSSSLAVNRIFHSLGDYERVSPLADLSILLNQGVRIALLYGDRDFICNWLGGEAASLSVAQRAGYPYAQAFPRAGYADLVVNSSGTSAGAIRQYGNLSFARVYDAGHLVPAYQPEAAFTLFSRIIATGERGRDLATGQQADLRVFMSKGKSVADHRNNVPPQPKPTCYVRALAETCSDAQVLAIRNGEGTVINGIWYAKESDWTLPDASATKPPAGTQTGAYVVPGGTGAAKKGAAAGRNRGGWAAVWGCIAIGIGLFAL